MGKSSGPKKFENKDVENIEIENKADENKTNQENVVETKVIDSKQEEKVCHNCQELMASDSSFCRNCGQKRAKLRISLYALLSDFFAQQFSIEGRLFKTLATLLFQPGQLTVDYCQGKRARYFTPIQLYLITSVLFYLLLDTASGVAPVSAFRVNMDDVRAELDSSSDEVIPVSFGVKGVEMTKAQLNEFVQTKPKDLEAFFEKHEIPMDATSMFFAKSSHAILQPGGMKAFFAKYFRLFSQTIMILMPVFGFILYGLYWRKAEGAVQCILFSAHVHSLFYIVFMLISLIAMFGPNGSLFALLSLGLFVHFVWSQKVVFGGYLVANVAKSFVALGVYLLCIFVFVILLLPLTFLTM